MQENFTLLAAGLGAIIALTILRVPSTTALVALLTGSVLANEFSRDAYDLLAAHVNISNAQTVQVGLFVLPLLLVIIFLRRKAPKSKLFLEILGNIALVTLFIMLASNLITPIHDLLANTADGQVEAYRGDIIGGAATLGFVVAWLRHIKKSSDKPLEKHGSKKH